MSYCTTEDLVLRYGQDEVTRLSSATGTLPPGPSEPRIAAAIADATATIESYLSNRYALPLSPVPAGVRAACCALARYNLALGGDRVPSDAMREERDRALAWLRDIAEDRANLSAASSAAGARVKDRARLLTPGLP